MKFENGINSLKSRFFGTSYWEGSGPTGRGGGGELCRRLLQGGNVQCQGQRCPLALGGSEYNMEETLRVFRR